MPYPAINERRMTYDIDGTAVGFRAGLAGSNRWGIEQTFANGISEWVTGLDLVNLNSETRQLVKDVSRWQVAAWWWFFPEVREVTALAMYFHDSQVSFNWDKAPLLQGSIDSTNGMDGSWETAVYTPHAINISADYWRSNIKAVSFSGPKKVLRFGYGSNAGNTIKTAGIHLYGRKAAGETPDDLLFVDASTGAEKTALMDWGDQPEGTTEIDSFKVKNASPDKIANNINLQLNHADFLMAWSADGPWTSVLDIATLGVGALSNTVYVRNKLEPPLLILGPYAARVIASVGSWT